MFADPLTARLVEFVRSVGIGVSAKELGDDTFLPGLDIRDGVLLIDAARLKYPGDILHEAGHIAVADPERRVKPQLKPTKGEEMAAMAWSYAAITHLGLPPEIVFHPDGYQGGNKEMIAAFADGSGPGTPLLAWFDMTAAPHGPDNGFATFPQMHRWLR